MEDDDRLNEPIEIVEPSSAWQEWFRAEAKRMAHALPAAAVEHFGSTAVEELAAKPIVDVLVGVASVDEVDRSAQCLSELGYVDLGQGGVPGTRFLVIRSDRCFNARVVPIGSDVWTDALLLRDYLRGSEEARQTYASAKRALFDGGLTRALDYGDAKDAVVKQLLAQARAWRATSA